MNQGHQTYFKDEEKAVSQNNEVIYFNNLLKGEKIYREETDPVVVYYPVGNYNEIKELGRFKSLRVAMAIISNFNNPDKYEAIPEYKIFSLETGAEIFSH